MCCIALAILGCEQAGTPPEQSNEALSVVTTTTIVGDTVARVGGDEMELSVLLPVDADPHDYIFRPVDMTKAANADLIFVNGGGLEGQLDRLLSAVTDDERIVSLADGVPLRYFDEAFGHQHEHDASAATCEHGPIDPHVWTDPRNVMLWADTIAEMLAKRLPSQADTFYRRAKAYKEELRELDRWIREQVNRIPEERRVLITDHLSLGYFADRYGFEQIGVLIRSFDSMAQASARNLGELIDVLRQHDVPAIFVGTNVNPTLAEQIARDTGTTLVELQSGALTGPDGPAPDYIAYMRHNVTAMVRHLGEMGQGAE